MDPTKTHDPAEIIRALQLILGPSQVTELRVLEAVTSQDRRPHVESGYFDAPEQLAAAVAQVKSAKGFYFTPNPINRALLARANNRVRAPGKEPLTADHDVVVRRWLLVDFDPVRPAGISSTDAEHNAAIELAFLVRAALSREGWPDPIVANSGNGAHLLYPVEVPVDDNGLIQRCLEALANRFDTDEVTIDQGVHNPARIWKLYGTLTAKGDDTPERPHRVSRILEAPDNPVVVEATLLDALRTPTDTLPMDEREHRGADRGRSFDLEQWIRDHGLDVDGPAHWHSGRRWVFNACPWNADHTNGSAFIVQHANGAIAAGCHHNGCRDKNWRALRDLIEPDWERARKCGENHNASKQKRTSQATRLVLLTEAAGVELWHTPNSDALATIDVAGHRENWPIKSRGFRRYLQRLYFHDVGGAPNAQAVQDALGALEGMAVFDGPEHLVWVRVAEHGDCVYLDLANANWEAIEVDAHGWRVVSDPPVKFRRAKAMIALPTPMAGGSVADLRRFVNIATADWPLLVAWLLAAMYPRGPYPVLVFSAEQGSGKSTTSRVLRSLIDPNAAPLRSEPREPRDLMIAANNGWVVAHDNVSHLPLWLSDALCRLSTGGGFSVRTLYENDEETIFDATRPTILNGIEDVITRNDLIDRALLVNLPSIPAHQRRPESEFWDDFEQARPVIFGAMLTALSVAIRNLPITRLAALPRMADFAVLATAGEPGLGLAPGVFISAYTNNRDDANALALEASPIANFITEMVASAPWHGTASQLLDILNQDAGDGVQRQKAWPKSPRALSGMIKRLAPNLRRAGVEVEQWRESAGKRHKMIALGRTAPEICGPVGSSGPNSEKPARNEAGSDRTGSQLDLFEAETDRTQSYTGHNGPQRTAKIPAQSDILNGAPESADVNDDD